MQPIYTCSRNGVGSQKLTSFKGTSQVGSMFSVLPPSLISSTYTVKNSPLARLTSKTLPVKNWRRLVLGQGAKVPADVRRIFMHHILEDEADGQKEEQGDQRKEDEEEEVNGDVETIRETLNAHETLM